MAFSFINDLEKTKNKKVFQSYDVKMGIDIASILIPLNKVNAFEAKIESTKPKNRTQLQALVEAFDGVIER
jgi:hypothetical protein